MTDDGAKLTSMASMQDRDVDFSLAPSDATWAGADKPSRCWNCALYSFKTYGGVDSTTGKCFRDRDTTGKVHYVDGLMVCPGFIHDTTDDK